jgi:hypothetical protein
MIKVQGNISNLLVLIFINLGANHNFVEPRVVTDCNLKMKLDDHPYLSWNFMFHECFKVQLFHGHSLPFTIT